MLPCKFLNTPSHGIKGYIRILVALALSISYFLFHMQLMQRYVDWDQYAYCGNVSLALVPGNTALLNPHHLHFELGGKLFHNWVSDTFGSAGFVDLAFNLRLRSLAAACIGLFFTVLFFSNISGKLAWGIIGGLLVGALHGYLHYATKIDTGIFPAAFLLPGLWAFERIGSTRGNPVFMSLVCGAIMFLCVIMHQYAVLAFVFMSIALVLPGKIFLRNKNITYPFLVMRKQDAPAIEKKPASRFSSWIAFSASGAVLIAGAYFYAGQTHYNLAFDKNEKRESKGIWATYTFPRWIFSYATTTMWGHGIERFNPEAPVRGFSDAFISQKPSVSKYNKNYNFEYAVDKPLEEKSFVYNFLAYFTLFVIAGTVCFFPALARRYGRTFIVIFLATIAYLVFFTYWEPFYFEFWIMPSVLLSVLFIMILGLISEKAAVLLTGAVKVPLYGLAVFFVCIFFAHNFASYLAPYSRERHVQGIGVEQEKYEWIFSPGVYRTAGTDVSADGTDVTSSIGDPRSDILLNNSPQSH